MPAQSPVVRSFYSSCSCVLLRGVVFFLNDSENLKFMGVAGRGHSFSTIVRKKRHDRGVDNRSISGPQRANKFSRACGLSGGVGLFLFFYFSVSFLRTVFSQHFIIFSLPCRRRVDYGSTASELFSGSFFIPIFLPLETRVRSCFSCSTGLSVSLWSR